MATFLVSLSRRRPLLNAILSRYHRWQWSRLRKYLCPSCGCEAATDPQLLVKHGQFRSAVLMARVELERALTEIIREIQAEHPNWRFNMRTGRAMIPYLLSQRRITKRLAHRANCVYARASRVIHGSACPGFRAQSIVSDAIDVIAALKASKPETVIVGFAAEGGAA